MKEQLLNFEKTEFGLILTSIFKIKKMCNEIKKILSILFLNFIMISGLSAANFIVAPDGSGDFTSVQSAIDACPDGSRSFIFIKNGTYYGQLSIGSKSVPTSKMISFIGENKDSVILTYDVSLSTVSTFEQATTVQIYAKNFYAENITFQNSAGNTGQALALYTAGDMSIFKNCTLKGYQDTYRSKKGTRGYFYNCWIEGAVDFIYAGGTLFFDDCTIYCTRSGGYVTAPEDAYATIPKASTATGIFIRLGFLFRNCTIKGPESVPANSFYLGRPWGDYAGSIYLNCKLSYQVNSAGWATMGSSTYLTSCFAEYNSMDLNGNPIDISKRISWSYQLQKSDADNLLTTAAVYSRSYTSTFDPATSLIQTGEPQNLFLNNSTLSWNNVEGASGYVIYNNGKILGYSTTNSFTISKPASTISVRAVNTTGVLSEASSVLSAIKTVNESKVQVKVSGNKIEFSEPVAFNLYAVNGKSIAFSKDLVSQTKTKGITNGIYLIQLFDSSNQSKQFKIVVF